MASLNFNYLRPMLPQLAELRGFAEMHVYTVAASSLSKMRTSVEKLVSGLGDTKSETDAWDALLFLPERSRASFGVGGLWWSEATSS